MPVNMSLFTNSSDAFVGLGHAADQASGGIFGIGLLLAVYFVTYTVTNYYGSRDAFITATFVGAISSILLRLMGWLGNDIWVFGAVVLLAISGIILVFRRGE